MKIKESVWNKFFAYVLFVTAGIGGLVVVEAGFTWGSVPMITLPLLCGCLFWELSGLYKEKGE